MTISNSDRTEEVIILLILLIASMLIFHSLDNVKLLANFPAYIRYWKTKFRVTSPSLHCTTMRARAAVGEGRQEHGKIGRNP